MSEAITREEQYLTALGDGTAVDIEPITREELFLAKAVGMNVEPPNPITRKEHLLSRITPGEGVAIRNQNKTVTENGSYTADDGYTGLGIVTVDVDTVNNQELKVTENGEYYPDVLHTGFSKVTVNVEGAPNGTSWEKTNESLNFTCVEYGDGVWCAGTKANGIYYSTDGKTWNPTAITGEPIFDIAYNGQYWFAGAYTGIYSCSNGTDWSTAEEHKVSFVSVKHIVSDHGTCIAVTHNGWICVHRGGVEQSWSSQVQISGASEPAYGDNTWVVGATGQIMVSKDDGVTWTAKATNYTDYSFTQFCYGKGVWVGVVNNIMGGYAYSTDRGENWTVGSANAFYNRNPEVCTYKDGTFILASYLGEMLTSAICYSLNGYDWTSASVDNVHGKFSKIFNYNGVWVALKAVPIENEYYNSRCGICYSLDGMTWQTSNITDDSWFDVVAGKNEWVAVGSSGACHSTAWEPN